jgi:hypothetical protein
MPRIGEKGKERVRSLRFFIGLNEPNHARHLRDVFISIKRLHRPGHQSKFEPSTWIMDSGAFSDVFRFGDFQISASDYAAHIRGYCNVGTLLAAVAQDYMCEQFILDKWGRTVVQHQEMTIARWEAIRAAGVGPVCLLPVLQGQTPADYVRHIRMYGARLAGSSPWVGVGSVCKRQGDPAGLLRVLEAIKAERPDFQLHGFGVKITALRVKRVRALLYSADSMAWSYNAMKNGRDWQALEEPTNFKQRVERIIAGLED